MRSRAIADEDAAMDSRAHPYEGLSPLSIQRLPARIENSGCGRTASKCALAGQNGRDEFLRINTGAKGIRGVPVIRLSASNVVRANTVVHTDSEGRTKTSQGE